MSLTETSIVLRMFFVARFQECRKHWWVIPGTAVAMENSFVTVDFFLRSCRHRVMTSVAAELGEIAPPT